MKKKHACAQKKDLMSLDAVGEVTVAGASGQRSRGAGLPGPVASGSAQVAPGAALGRVGAVGSGLALDRRLVGLGLGTSVTVVAARVASVGVGVAVLLLGAPHARTVAHDVVARRL